MWVNISHGSYGPIGIPRPFWGGDRVDAKRRIGNCIFFKQGLLNTKLGCKKGNRIEVFFLRIIFGSGC